MYFQGLLLVFLAASASAYVYRESVRDKWGSVVACGRSFSTSTFCDAPRSYEFFSKTGEPFKIYCYEFSSAPCDKASMTFRDGDEKFVKCGPIGPFLIKSKSSEMTAELTGAGANMACYGKLIFEPRNYELIVTNPTDGGQTVKGPNTSFSEATDQAWRILTSIGNKIVVDCTIELAKKLNGECVAETLSIDSGEGWKQYCGKGKVTAESSGPEVKIRLETFKARGEASCTVRSVKA